MKLLLTCSIALCAAGASLAQTTNTPPTSTNGPAPQSFFQTATGYFTTFNTNLQTFGANAPFRLWTGAAYQSGLNIGAQVGLEARPFTKFPGLTLGSVSTMAGVAGTFANQEEDIAWNIVHYDVELSVGAGASYDFTKGHIRPAGYAEIKKALTDNTFAGMRLEALFDGGKQSQPVVTVFAGFSF